ncbi:MAG: hydroxymethylbilane synthase [Proteobacteria bacterium]|nr:hydroxymethylbilane synthase [Pseudomonadota bacterium]
MAEPLTIGTRGSPLALAQANLVAGLLATASGGTVADFPLTIIRTTGDATQDRALADIGGKGLFTKEIDAAQLGGSVDVAVHSAKDLPTSLPEGLVVAGYLPREDVRDAFIGHGGRGLMDLPKGAVVGTVSLRRQALLRRLRPDLEIIVFRGNVGTRLDKVARGEVDGTLLALAGLKRLGLADRATEFLDATRFPPAVGQAAIAIVTRLNDARTMGLVSRIIDRDTGTAVQAERGFLTALDGSCRMPIAAHAVVREGRVVLSGMVLSPDGRQAHDIAGEGAPEEAEALGLRLGSALRHRLGEAFLAALKA